MPAHSEIFEATIKINLPEGDALLEKLAAIEKRALDVGQALSRSFQKGIKDISSIDVGASLTQISSAFGGLGDGLKSTGGIDDLAIQFENLAVSAAKSAAEIAIAWTNISIALTQPIDNLISSIGSAITALDISSQLGAMFDNLAAVASTGWTAVSEAIAGGAAESLGSLATDAGTEMSNVVSNIEAQAPAIQEALIAPFRIAYDRIVGHSILTRLNADATGEVADMVAGIMGEMTNLNMAVEFQKQSKEIQNEVQLIARVLDTLPSNFGRLDQAILTTATSIGDTGENISATLKGVATLNFDQTVNGLMAIKSSADPAIQTIDRFSAAIRLAQADGGSAFLALRNVILGVAPATNTATKAFDFLTSRMTRAGRGFTALQRDLLKVSKSGRVFADETKLASTFLIDLAKNNKSVARELTAVDKALHNNTRAWNVAANSAAGSGKVTERAMADVESAIDRVRRTMEAVKKESDLSLKPLSPNTLKQLDAFGKTMEAQTNQLKLMRATARAASKEVEVLGETEKAAGEQTNKATGAFTKFVEVLKKLKPGVKDTGKELYSFGDSTDATALAMTGLTGGMFKALVAAELFMNALGTMKDIAGKVIGVITNLSGQIFGLDQVKRTISGITNGFVDLAAKVDTLEFTIRALGENAAIPIEYLNEKVQDLRKSGITTRGAYQSLIKFMSQKIPLDKITQLSRAAQDMAVAFGVNSTQAFERFTQSIVRGSTVLLRQFGIQNASMMFEKYARTIDKSVNSMTNFEKQQAILNGILEAAAPFAGAYETALDSVGKKIGSLDRKIEETALVLGQIFLPVLGNTIDKLGDFTSRLTGMFEKAKPGLESIANLFVEVGNGVYEFVDTKILPALSFLFDHLNIIVGSVRLFASAIGDLFGGNTSGAIEKFKQVLLTMATFVKKAFGEIVIKAAEWGKNTVRNLVKGIREALIGETGILTEAYNWGVGLVNQISSGLLDAAGAYLTQVLTWIADTIASFFAPGSPPKEGPLKEIDKWGGGLMQVLADGMASTSSSVFASGAFAAASAAGEAIKSSFRDLGLESFRIIRETMGPIKQWLQTAVGAGDLDQTQLIPQMQKIRDLMVELANNFEDTGKISDEVLDKIAAKFGDAGEDIREFIRLQFALQKAREDFKAIEAEIDAAQSAGFVSAGLKKKAKDKINEIKKLEDQFALQKELIAFQQENNELVRQQIDLLKRIADAQEKAAAAAAKGKKDEWQAFLDTYDAEMAALDEKKRLGIITEEEYQRARLGLEQRYIDTAIRLGKPLTQERIDAFKELQKLVSGFGGGGGADAFSDINQPWEDFISQFDGAETEVTGAVENMRDSIGGLWTQTEIDFELARMKMEESMTGLFSDVKFPFIDNAKTAFDTIAAKFTESAKFNEITTKISGVWEEVKKTTQDIVNGIVAFATTAIGEVIGGSGVSSLISAIANYVVRYVGAVVRGIQHIARVWQSIFGKGGDVQDETSGFVKFMTNLGKIVGKILNFIAGTIATVINVITPIVERVIGIISRVIAEFAELFGTIITRITESTAIQTAFQNLVVFLELFWRQLKPILELIGGIIGGIIAVAVGLIDGLLNAMAPFAGVIISIIELFLNLANVILTPIALVIDTIYTLFNEGPQEAFKVLQGHFENWKNAFTGIFTSIWNIITGIVQTIFGFLVGFVDGIVGTITGKFGTVIDTINGIWAEFKRVLGLLFPWLTLKISNLITKLPALVETLKNWFSDRWDDVYATFTTAITTIGGKIKEVTDKVEEKLTEGWDRIKEIWEEFRDDPAKILGELWTKVQEVFIDIKISITGKLGEIVKVVTTKAQEIWDSIIGKFEEVKTSAETKFEEVKTAIKTKIGEVPGIIEDIIPDMLDAGKKIIQGLKDGLEEKWEEVKDWFGDKLGGFMDWLPGSEPKNKKSPLTGLKDAGKAIFENLIKGMANAETAEGVMTDFTSTIITALLVASDGYSEFVVSVELSSYTLYEILREVSEKFDDLRNDVVGPSGSMTLMVKGIIAIFRAMSSTYGILNDFVRQVKSIFSRMATDVVALFKKMGTDSAESFMRGVSILKKLIDDWMGAALVGGILDVMYRWGLDMMYALSLGLSYGFGTYVLPVLADIERIIKEKTKFDNRSASLSALPSPLPAAGRELGVSAGGGRSMIFERGAFEGAFPSITSGDEAEKFVDLLDDLVMRGKSVAMVGV